MSKTILKVQDAVKEFKMGEIIVRASDRVSFEVEEGEFVVILGPSGSGKSTILNMIGGMDKLTSGEILIDGKNISGFSDKQLTKYRRKEVGFVFQFYNLIPTLTAYENIEMAERVSAKSLDINEIMAALELLHRKDSFPAQMSGGEQQRVSIARAVVKNPTLLLCDEPTGALDYNTGKSVLKLLRDINRKMNKTTLVITHNAAIANMADKVIKMRSGSIESMYVNNNPLSPEGVEW